MTSNYRGLGYRVLLAMAVIVASLATAAPSNAVSGTKRLLVVLCNFANQDVEPKPRSYYEDLFGVDGQGKLGSYDYWRDVSDGQLTLDATVVGWYTIPIPRDAWRETNMDRVSKWKSCVERAAADVHYESFVSAIVVYPEAITKTAAGIAANDTSVTVTTDPGALLPTPPFLARISDSATAEKVRVTAVSGTTYTIERGQDGDMPAVHAAGSWLQVIGADLFGGGPAHVQLGGLTQVLGMAFGPHDLSLSGFMHETAHSLGLGDSMSLSTFPNYYNDCYDTLSIYSCTYQFDGKDDQETGLAFGGSMYYPALGKGPGLNSLNLDTMGWLPASRKTTFDASSCRQQTYTMAALNHPEAAGYLQLRFDLGSAAFDHFAVELRHKSGWDRAIPQSAFLLHAQLADGRSMIIDRNPDGSRIGGTRGDGALTAGSAYANTTLGMYLGVNRVDEGPTGQVTMGSCTLDTELEYVGATRGQHTDTAALSARLTTAGSAAPVPGANVQLGVGSKTCTAATGANGVAQCSVVLDQAPGTYSVTASFAGNAVWQSATDSAVFTVDKERTEIVYAGPTTSDYHDRFVVFAQLADDDGVTLTDRSVTFTLGSGDSCTDVTGPGGLATCSITPTQPAGEYILTTTFAGDSNFEASTDRSQFAVSHEESTTTSTVPGLILAGSGSQATVRAQFFEDGANGDGTNRTAVPAGQTISFTLGSQRCSATTDASGSAQCTLTVPSNTALGPQTVTTAFAGDAYYEPSSDTKNAIVFAFPQQGAFTLGNNTVASATASSTMTFWSDAWYLRNSMTGGVAPDSYKGFGQTVTALPTTNPANSCGTTFRTVPGNSPAPPATVPSYMGVLVASSAVKSGSAINGQWGKVVVVKTDGYSPKPGRTGTGTIVGTFCS